MKKTALFFLVFYFFIFSSNADINPTISREKHFKTINNITKTTDGFITTGDDGYLIEWDKSFTGKHYQLSPLEIKISAKNPVKNELAVYETDGFSIYRLSVWNLEKHELMYSHRFIDSITFLNYSANGTYLIAGTTSVNGLLFLESYSGNPVSIFEEEISAPLFAKTNKSENTCIVYSSNGMLFYGDMKTGTEKAVIECPAFLEKPVLFSNNMYLAGTSYDGIHIVNAVTGEELCTAVADNPFLLCELSDKDLYYCEYNKTDKCYELKMISLQQKELNYIPLVVNTFVLENNEELTSITKNKTTLMLGSKNGNLYRFSTAASTQKALLSSLTEDSFLKIIDIGILKDKLIILTKENLYQSNFENESIIKLNKNTSENLNISCSKDIAVLWTKNEKKTVNLLSFNNDIVKINKLYTPEKPVNSLHICNNKIISIEGNSCVTLFDLNINKKTEVYNGTGLQDAIVITDDKKENIIIAKASSTSPKFPLICLNLETKETVPLPIETDIVLTLNNSSNNFNFYGISNITQEQSKKTEIFTYNLNTKAYTPVSYWTDEDTEVFIDFFNENLITNIGKNSVRSINLIQKNETLLQRQNALTKKICTSTNYLITLNTDYSISLYNAKIKYLQTRHYALDLKSSVSD